MGSAFRLINISVLIRQSIIKKLISLIVSTPLLASCSGPDSSGGVEFSKTDNSFPHDNFRGPGYQAHHTGSTGCGLVTVHEKISASFDINSYDARSENLILNDAKNLWDVYTSDLNHARLT